MLRYIVQRALLAFPVLLGVVTIVFVVVRVLPGDPAVAALGDQASAAAVAALREQMGLNDPLPLQYLKFLADLARGDLGRSLINGTSVRDQVAHNLPFTLELTFAALIVGIGLGIPTGVYAAVHRNKMGDYVSRVLSLAGLSVPAFYLGILLILLFAILVPLFPAVGGATGEDVGARLRALVLPAVTLGLVMTAALSRLTRSAMLNVLSQDYVRTAQAKGLRHRVVLFRHALRSALIPIASLTGIWVIGLIGDSVTTELVFSRPGLGKMMVGAMLARDYTSLQSILVVYAAFVVFVNLIVDLAYGVLDPRARR